MLTLLEGPYRHRGARPFYQEYLWNLELPRRAKSYSYSFAGMCSSLFFAVTKPREDIWPHRYRSVQMLYLDRNLPLVHKICHALRMTISILSSELLADHLDKNDKRNFRERLPTTGKGSFVEIYCTPSLFV